MLKAYAAEKRLTPSITLRNTYDDNIFLDEGSDLELSASPKLEYMYSTPTSSLSLAAAVDIYRYLDEDQYDRENQAYSLNSKYPLNERLSLSLGANFNIDYTFEEALEETGEVTQKNKRHRYSLAPGLEYQLAPRYFLRLNPSINMVDYRSGDNDDDRDYQTYGLNLVLGHEWTAKTTLFLMLDYGLTDVDDLKLSGLNVLGTQTKYGQFDQEQHVYQAMVGVEHQYTRNLSFSLRAGTSLSTTEYEEVRPLFLGGLIVGTATKDIDEENTGLVVEGGLDYEMQRSNLSLDLSRSVSQSTDGESINRNRVRFSITRYFSERLRGILNASYVRSKSVSDADDVGDGVDTETYSFSPGLSYVLTENSALELRYNYRAVDDDVDDDHDQRNRIYLQYSWSFPWIMD
jgi:opacity protein-like surface antigen